MDVSTLIRGNAPLPAGLTTTGDLYLSGYAHPLPAGLTTTGYLYLSGYAHPLPAGLTTTGDLVLRGYAHPLPAGLTTTGYLVLSGYAHPLPAAPQPKDTRKKKRAIHWPTEGAIGQARATNSTEPSRPSA